MAGADDVEPAEYCAPPLTTVARPFAPMGERAVTRLLRRLSAPDSVPGPEGVLMIAGELSGVPFLTGVRELVYQRAMPRATANLQVVTSRLGDHAGLVGAAAMVVEHLYSPAGADARLNRVAP